MRLPLVPTLPMTEHLNTIYFDKVWNAPDDHGRANFPLAKAAQRLQTGAVPVSLSVVGLPTTDTVYAVYKVAVHVFGRFVSFPYNNWITDLDLVATDTVSISVYTITGRLIPKGCIHLRYIPARGIVLVAIDRQYTAGCTDISYPDLYFSVYKDTSRTTPITSQVYQVTQSLGQASTSAIVTQALSNAYTSYPVGTCVYVNGWHYDQAYIPSLVVGDIVSIIIDPDIIGFCDLIIDDNQTGYYSNLYTEYRESLHLPKILNPTNTIITHDTIDIAIFDITTHRGVYGHRLDPHAIESITHNDYSMSRTTLQSFQDALSAQSISVRLYVRYATQPQVLGNDVNHIADLYTLDDGEIKKQLAGLSDHQILEWKASHLEQSSYLKLLYQFPGFPSDDVLSMYVEAIGYYDVASTLSQSMHYYTYQGAQVEIQKPVRLIGYPCQVIVYADGRKIPTDAIGMSDYTSKSFLLGFKSNSYVKIGSRIAVYIAESGIRTPIAFAPTLANPSIILDNEDYQLIKVITYTQDQQIWGGTTLTGYHSIPVSPGDYRTTLNADGSVTYTVSSIHYGDHFYMIPACGMMTTLYPLDSLLSAKDPLIIPLTTSDENGYILPITGYQSLEVYIDGYRLIEGLDYSCDPIMGANDDVLQTLLEISNMDYLNLSTSGNILEVVIHGDIVASVDKGYVISKVMHRSIPPMIWSKSCGRAFAHGLLVEEVNEIGNLVIADSPIADGSPYLLEWSLPFSVRKLMANQSPNSDIDLRTRIDRVLNFVMPTYPKTVILTNLYSLYSPYLAQIISDVANGSLTIVDELKDDQFLKQFSQYNLLYARDPVISSVNPLIDRRFVTLAASYANFAIQDDQQMLLVQRLIMLLLTPSPLSIQEVLV